MANKALITIKGIQGDILDDEKIEMVVTGELYHKNEKIYIHYLDTLLDIEKETKTSIKIEPEKISITRFGATNTHLVFEKGVAHYTPYETAFGTFHVRIFTESIKLQQDPGQLDLEVIYVLEIDQMSVGNSSIVLRVTELPEEV